MEVVIIGTGNVAYALARLIKGSEHHLVQVAGRNPNRTADIGKALGIPFSRSITDLNKSADLYIVAISDDALHKLGEWLKLDKKLVVHTAGSVSKDVLASVSKNYGVLWPLQTLKKQVKDLPEIPFVVDGNTPDDLALIKDFALSVSGKVEVADDETRIKLHLAAVVVNNLSNHLYTLTEKFCSEEKISFDLLQPLIAETARRITYMSPKDAQTGPAIRNDISTIEKQKEILQNHPELKKVYEVITRSIRRR